MFFLSNPEIDLDTLVKSTGFTYKEIEEMSDEEFAQLEQTSDILHSFSNPNISSSYSTSLYYYTYRKDLALSQLTCTTITPDSFIYYSMPKRETDVFLRNLTLHRHNFYELLYVIDGELYQTIEETRHIYSKGSFCLMNKNIHHCEEYSDYSRILFLQFSDNFLSSVLHFPSVFPNETSSLKKIKEFWEQFQENDVDGSKSYIDFIPTEESILIKDELYNYFEEISSCLSLRETSSSLKIAHLLLKLLYHLFNPSYFSTTPINIGTEKQREIFNELSDYIDSRMGRVSRKELEDVFHYSGDYIYQIIRKYTGHSIASYCMQISMKYAAKYLSTTTASVQDVCLMLGFSNRTQFYNEFKKAYGVTPKTFKKNIHP